MELVTALFVLTMTAAGATLLQTAGETRFVVDCNVNPAALVGHVKITLAPEGIIVSCGGSGNERLNTVPLPELPPCAAVPYRVLPDKINPAYGVAPSLGLLILKLCRVAKPPPKMLTANTVPPPELPPRDAVP